MSFPHRQPLEDGAHMDETKLMMFAEVGVAAEPVACLAEEDNVVAVVASIKQYFSTEHTLILF